jgi:hypothetical protein
MVPLPPAMVSPKVDPKAKQIQVIVTFNRKDLTGKEAWESGWVYLPAHPQFGIKTSPKSQEFFDHFSEIDDGIRKVLAQAGVTIRPQ